jgi:hypothetical protein
MATADSVGASNGLAIHVVNDQRARPKPQQRQREQRCVVVPAAERDSIIHCIRAIATVDAPNAAAPANATTANDQPRTARE